MNDLDAFFVTPESIDVAAHLLLTYRFLPDGAPRDVAAHLCAEMSTAMWQRVGASEDLRPRFAAKITRLAPCTRESFREWFELDVAYPLATVGLNLSGLLTCVMGEGTLHAPGLRGIVWEDVIFPREFLSHLRGPQFGVAGIRAQLDVQNRPIFFGVVKPNLGLSPEDFSALARAVWEGGLDIAKDDEMLANPPWSPLSERVACVTRARIAAEKSTGLRKSYLANITDDGEKILERLREAERGGANAVLLNPMWTSFASLAQVRTHAQIPLMSHFAGLALLQRNPLWSISSRVVTLLQRIAGADMIGIPGFGARMHADPLDVHAAIDACLQPIAGVLPALPIPGGSDSAATLASVCDQVGHSDFGFIAGRGVFGHPEGPRAGAASLHTAWRAYRA